MALKLNFEKRTPTYSTEARLKGQKRAGCAYSCRYDICGDVKTKDGFVYKCQEIRLGNK